MKKVIALEEVAQFGICIYALPQLQVGINGWIFLAFFIPDLFAAGYFFNNKVGAILYNFAHHKLPVIVLIMIGFFFKQAYCIYAGLLAYAHTSFDRILGYGLKYADSFGHTHLSYIGKRKPEE